MSGIETYNKFLSNVIDYKNEDVILSFTQKYEINEETATKIFEDMIRFLSLSRIKGEDLCVIDDPILIIDEMWHLFILHTQEYFKFCRRYFGEYMHHHPTVRRPTEKQIRAIDQQKEYRLQFIEKKRKRYLALYHLLGEEVFNRWFHEYATKFSKASISGLRRY